MVSRMDVKRHDEVRALTTHLPHVLAFNMVHALSAYDYILIYFDMPRAEFVITTGSLPHIPACALISILTSKHPLLASLDRYTKRLPPPASCYRGP
jgi:Prephenate dehydrogenase